MPDQPEGVVVPGEAVKAAEERLIGENPPGIKAWHDQTRVEIRATLEAALPVILAAERERHIEILRGVEEERDAIQMDPSGERILAAKDGKILELEAVIREQEARAEKAEAARDQAELERGDMRVEVDLAERSMRRAEAALADARNQIPMLFYAARSIETQFPGFAGSLRDLAAALDTRKGEQ